jgi:phosphomannomutase/phosphoglucomutase
MWKVGHSLIKEKMKEEKALLAGEMSGHIFFAHRYFGYDDAIYSAARLVELLSREQRTLTELVDTLPKLHNTPEIRYELPDEIKFEVVKRIVERFKRRDHGIVEVVDVDGARVLWKDAWALVRASNTQPALVLRFEAETAPRLGEVEAFVRGELQKIESELKR